ncbi:redoxin domain-containing protein [Sphingomonas histidinilytica]|jgi:peroxiredoxin Q/BCP|uniref:thioredoxin-dependent peroxiredoxin n=1 Tax=Rhizorhabdus histidinilytica TaxID=439228 RepID=A0A1T5B102_9SPHN|nr:peroxiredoxin [Rhizorhabdus histidinilytica]MBO9377812.1 redoxin domain-containing protein [Rhizorhabdus histidinilytica]QEH79478.1 peroxiredoxin [Sphingomonas sp. C8-2]SKB40747.1 peroxiredoxin Q/BCP [Rhizorhabdus histidinilytica]
MLKEGDKAPNVTLDLPDGSKTSVAGEAGKILVLYFYPKDDTPGCTTEAQGFTALADDFARAGATIIGVSKDSAARHQKFIDKYGLKLRLASDSDGSVCEAFGTWIEKSLYGRQYMGIDRATFLIGKDGTIARIWRKVKVKGHAEEVLAAAKAL